MVFLQLLPVVLSTLVLGAHFLRSGQLLFVLATLAMVVLVFVRRPWAARVIQAGLLVGAIVWLYSLVMLVSFRMQTGAPFTRLAIILGSVALVTGASALMFRTNTLRRRFGLSSSD